MAEHLATTIGARTIFATHYHELNELASLLPSVGNAQVLVEETGDDLIFLHRVSRGGASRSYGIEAARLAGVPAPVVLRARQVLSRIEANSHVAVGISAAPVVVEPRIVAASAADGAPPDATGSADAAARTVSASHGENAAGPTGRSNHRRTVREGSAA